MSCGRCTKASIYGANVETYHASKKQLRSFRYIYTLYNRSDEKILLLSIRKREDDEEIFFYVASRGGRHHCSTFSPAHPSPSPFSLGC